MAMEGKIGKYKLTLTNTAAYNKYMQPHIKPTDEIVSTYVVTFGEVIKLYITYVMVEEYGASIDKYLLMSYIDKPKVLTAARPGEIDKIVKWLDTLESKLIKGGLL